MVSVVNGTLKEVCSAKVRNLGEKVGQACVNQKGEVKRSLREIEVPTWSSVFVNMPLKCRMFEN